MQNVIDVTRTLGRWTEQPPEQWLRALNRVGPPAVTAVLVLLIAYRLAGLTWTLVPDHTFDRPAPVIVQPGPGENAGRSASSFPALAGSHLFGEAPAAAPEPVVPVNTEVDAPDTTLGIRLTGLIAVEQGDAAQAMIAGGRGQEKKYAIGQAIDGTNGATLHAVYRDRVIINRGGQLETLRLPKDVAATSSVAAARPAPQPRAADDASLRTVLSDNASQLTDIMRMAPHIEGGQMIGFRINPGRDRETFEALGLMPGDIVTDINGMILDDPSRALQVFEALGESTQANVTIVRDGTPTVMVIDTSQLQSLVQDRQ